MTSQQPNSNSPFPEISPDWSRLSESEATETWLFQGAGGAKLVAKRTPFVGSRSEFDRQVQFINRVNEQAIEGLRSFDQCDRKGDHCLLFRRFVEGQNLRDFLELNPQSSELPKALRLCLMIGNSLRRLHQNGVLFANLKPSNIVISECDEVTLVDGTIDFSRLRCTVDQVASRDHIAYYSPEQLGVIDERPNLTSDLYSFGIVIFEALCGKHPFADFEPEDVLVRKLNASPLRITDRHGNTVPRVVCELISRLTCSSPADRYQTIDSVCHDLELVISRLESSSNPSIALGCTDQRMTIVEPNFVGREREVIALAEELENGSQGMAGTIAIEAVSGCGKSTLLKEYSALAKHAGYWVVNGIGQVDVASQSFQILDGMVNSIVKRCKEDPAFQVHLTENLQDEIPTLLEVLPALAKGLRWEKKQQTGPDAFAHTRVIRAVCKLMSLLGTPQKPCTIVLDDCQWMDESTVKLIEQWNKIQKASPLGSRYVLVVLSFRHEEVRDSHPLRNLDMALHLHFDLFQDAEIHAIAGSMVGRLPERVTHLVSKMAGGSPFLATAVVRGMLETNSLRATDDGWQVNEAAIDDLQSSQDAAKLLARRIDLLPEQVRQLLVHGAILGKAFDIGLANQLLGDRLIELEEAVRKNLIWIDDDGRRGHFVHDKIREELLERQDDETRCELHRRTARLMEGLEAPSFIELAYHYDAAGEHEAALPYALDSAEKARRQFSVNTAASLYEIAKRGNTSDQGVRFLIARGLGEVLMLDGQYVNSATALEEAAELAENSFDRAQVLGKQGELAFKRGDMETATIKIEASIRGLGAVVPRTAFGLAGMFIYEVLVQVLHSLLPRLFGERKKRLPNEEERLRLHLGSRYAQACWFARSKFRCMWTHFRTLNQAEEYLPCAEVAQAFSDHAPAMSLIPWASRGGKYAKLSLAMRRELNDTWGQGQSLHYYGIVLYAAGQFEECIVNCREAVRLLEKTGDHWELHMARYQIAASLYQLGNLDEARREAQLLHESGIELGDQQASGISLDVIARTSLGSPGNAIFERELGRERFDSQGMSQLQLGQGVQQLGQGELAKAVKTFKAGLKHARLSGIRSVYILPNFAWLASALRCQAEEVAAYQPGKKRKLVAQSQMYARRMLVYSWPRKHCVPHALRELGLTSAMEGKQRRACRYLKQSIAVAKKHGMKYEEQLSRIALLMVNQRRTNVEKLARKIDATPNASQIFQFEQLKKRNDDECRTVSLAERFNRVMASGRDIASALNETSILAKAEISATQLLRAQDSYILPVRLGANSVNVDPTDDIAVSGLELELVQNAIVAGHSLSMETFQKSRDAKAHEGSALAAPILVRGKVHSCLLVVHRDVNRLFNSTEEKLADFVTTIAGAALENAQGFSQMQRVNEDLERRVDERTDSLQRRAGELSQANMQLKATARDLTVAQKQLTAAKERVELASQAKSEFLATMSHEIRTPMNAVMGMTELCMATNLDDNQRGYLGIVKSSAKSLLTLLNDILDLSKIEANKMELESIPFVVGDIAETACDLLSVNAFQKDLEVVCRVRTDVPAHVIGDPNRLQQVLVNLIGNAIKFTAEGQVAVDIQQQAIDRATGKVCLRFAVSDTGVGIAKDKQQSIFESFSQADSSTTRRFGGTGLGLSICCRFAEMMNGRLWVESECGEGSTFYFEGEFDLLPQSPQLTGLSIPPKTTSDVASNEPSSILVCLQNDMFSTTTVEVLANQFPTASIRCLPLRSIVENLKTSSIPECDLLIVDVDQQVEEGPLLDLVLEEKWDQSLPILGVFRKDRAELLNRYEASASDNSTLQMEARPLRRERMLSAINSLFMDEADEQRAKDAQAAAKKPAEKPRKALRVLLAEDVEINAMIATEFIKRMGHSVTVAENGLKALEAIDNGDFDVVLMDIEMPEMDGLETTREIRSRSTDDSSIPIVAMTAHALPEIQQQCIEAGMNHYITKPIEIETLQAALDEIE